MRHGVDETYKLIDKNVNMIMNDMNSTCFSVNLKVKKKKKTILFCLFRKNLEINSIQLFRSEHFAYAFVFNSKRTILSIKCKLMKFMTVITWPQISETVIRPY